MNVRMRNSFRLFLFACLSHCYAILRSSASMSREAAAEIRVLEGAAPSVSRKSLFRSPKKITKLVLVQFQSFSLAPWLQPGGSDVSHETGNRFKRFPVICLATGHRAKAAVRMRAKLIQNQ